MATAITMGNIGDVYDDLEKLNEALGYYKKALVIKERIRGKESIEYADTLHSIGLAYFNQAKLK